MIKSKYDLNRFKKVYPLLRVKPIYDEITMLTGDSGIDVELAILNYQNEFTKSYSFVKSYTSIPIIAATPEDENVNVFITSLTTTSVTIESSSEFTGKVHLQIYKDED